ncbi:MAG TPA: CYTH domain-containing protein [Burkholderiales bacterium]|nr:CYTH domain-containing protein [Burkholderiales bacterium]
MPLERELKLAVAPGRAATVARVLRLPRGRILHSVYFDTPRGELRRRRIALRLRRDGGRWLQTVKGERSADVRNEWETPVRSRSLELARLPLAAIRRATGIDLESIAAGLAPIFETRFMRRSRIVERGKAKIEIALDRGSLRAGRRRCAISEIELELKAGRMRALRREAGILARRFGLEPVAESKAARGYRLAEGK